MAVRTIKKSWWVDFRFSQARYRKRSPENSRAGAQAYEALLRHRLARGEQINQKSQDSLKILFAEFAATWFEQYVVPNNKFSERKAKQYILSASLVPFFGKLPVSQISSQHIEQYKAHEMRTGVSNKTINNRLTVLSKCLLIGYEWLDLETRNPKIRKLKCPPAKTDYLSREEADLLLSRAGGIFREMLLMTLRTGMRQGEVKGLQWEAIDWQHRTLTVRHSWNEDSGELEAPKNNRDRVIPLDIELYEVLLRRKAESGFVFLSAFDRPFNGTRLNTLLARLCTQCDLRRVTWHVLRHSFATHLMTAGAPPNTVQMLLGHATITTTMRYAHVPSASLREAVSLLRPRPAAANNLGQPAVNRHALAA